MPRYHFDIQNGHRLEDPAGLECKDDHAAAKQGRLIAAKIAEEVPSAAKKRRISVVNEERDEVASITIGGEDGG